MSDKNSSFSVMKSIKELILNKSKEIKHINIKLTCNQDRFMGGRGVDSKYIP